MSAVPSNIRIRLFQTIGLKFIEHENTVLQLLERQDLGIFANDCSDLAERGKEF